VTETPTAAAAASATPSPAAVRMRRHRERRRDGLRCLTIELRESEIGALVGRGFLPQGGRNDRNAVLQALYSLLEQELDPEA